MTTDFFYVPFLKIRETFDPNFSPKLIARALLERCLPELS